MSTDFGMPIDVNAIRKKFKKFIKKHNLPDVVFHSIRIASLTYKMRLYCGDIKAVQGDSGHADARTLLKIYARIIEADRKYYNAQRLEEGFYEKKNLHPSDKDKNNGNKLVAVPEGMDAQDVEKVLANSEMAAELNNLIKKMKEREAGEMRG